MVYFRNYVILYLKKYVYQYISLYALSLYSHALYGCMVWSYSTQCNIDRIIKLQKRCIEIITYSEFKEHTGLLFPELKLLKIKDIFSLKVQSCKLYNNKYMIASTKITNTEVFAFIAALVFKLLSHQVLLINRKDNRNC